MHFTTGELQRIGNAALDKQIFLVVGESTLFGVQYLNRLVGRLEISHVSYLYDCQFLPRARNSNSIAKAVDIAVRYLKSKETRFVFCRLMLQNI